MKYTEQAPIRRNQTETATTARTLEETVAGETAQLLIDAAQARSLAAQFKNEVTVTDLLGYAASLEHHAANWEKRLGWWKQLRQRELVRKT